MALLTDNVLLEGDGFDLTFAAAAGGGDTYTWSSTTMLIVQNDDASSKTVTIVPTTTSHKQPGIGITTKDTIAHVVAANTIAIIDTRSQAFKNTSGLVAVTYSAVTSVTVAAVKQVKI